MWAPLVETNAQGTAKVEFRVPDTLTTWRILALGHTRDGAQAGSITTFDSRLPVYIEPVVPGWLFAGDELALPIQIVNTSSEAISTRMTVDATGPLGGSAQAVIVLPPGASDLRRFSLSAEGAGAANVRAVLVGGDAVEREIPVFPQGRPVGTVRGGTLSSERSFELSGPSDADSRTQELSLLVFPGPLSVLQSEIERGASGTSAWDAAYTFAVAAEYRRLSETMKLEVDDKLIRRQQLVAWQRISRHSLAPDAGTATDLLAALRNVHGHELAEGLAARLARDIAGSQRADGTWLRGANSTRQGVIVQTAFAARTLPETMEGPRLKAAGALERIAAVKDVKDPYTAAVVLASGLVDGDSAKVLREKVLEGIVEVEGVRTVQVPGDVINPWGWTPTQAEMLAWTSLALADQADLEWRGDLVAELMSGYDARNGFGAGPANVIALEAVVKALPGLDKEVEVQLFVDGVKQSSAKLDPSQPKVPALLSANHGGKVSVKVSPQTPGLAFVATLHSWVPWSGAEKLAGVDVEVDADRFTVGDAGEVKLTLAAPSGVSLVLEQGLPAGASVDDEQLARLADRLVEWEVETDRVRLVTRPFQAGEVMEIPLHVTPAFAGTFSTTPLSVEPRGEPWKKAEIKPVTWVVGQ